MTGSVLFDSTAVRDTALLGRYAKGAAATATPFGGRHLAVAVTPGAFEGWSGPTPIALLEFPVTGASSGTGRDGRSDASAGSPERRP